MSDIGPLPTNAARSSAVSAVGEAIASEAEGRLMLSVATAIERAKLVASKRAGDHRETDVQRHYAERVARQQIADRSEPEQDEQSSSDPAHHNPHDRSFVNPVHLTSTW
ncbi:MULTISPECIES: hypothetical protein [Halococcus]|uniref:hypothetical protein n=1 Tax=Halococcus TaxID=2249 RepID=UPI0013758C1B|nr:MULTISPECIES: hypothetical protein [Halococcus]